MICLLGSWSLGSQTLGGGSTTRFPYHEGDGQAQWLVQSKKRRYLTTNSCLNVCRNRREGTVVLQRRMYPKQEEQKCGLWTVEQEGTEVVASRSGKARRQRKGKGDPGKVVNETGSKAGDSQGVGNG